MFLRKKLFWLVVLVAVVGLVFRYLQDIVLFISEPLQAWECKKIGGEWGMCFLSGPCCDKRFADGGKECIKGRDCLSGICVIVGEVPLIAQDNYVGKCPPYRVGNPFEFSEPYCSEAQIENGRIVKDLRKEFCPIY